MEHITIGDQIWTKQNSTIKVFSNGDAIHHSESREDWEECGLLEKPAWCYYNFDPSNEKYGLLYNGYVLLNSIWEDQERREIYHDGFGVADFADWNKLEEYIGGKDQGDKLKSAEGWDKIVTDENQNKTITPTKYSDKYRFDCLPSGWVNGKGDFYQLGSIAKFWTSTDDDEGKLWARIVGFKFVSARVKPENGFTLRLIQKIK